MNILVFNEYWEYQRTITPSRVEYPTTGPYYSIYINGSIYVTTYDVINKYDNNLTVKNQTLSSDFNNGIYYYSTNQKIYVSNSFNQKINVYDIDLNFIRNISTDFYPAKITEYNSQLVVTDNDNGNIKFYQGESPNRTVATNCNDRVSSVLFDNNNQMLVLCYDSNIYVYNVNGTYTGLQLNACDNNVIKYVNFDSKDRLVFICDNRIEIFY